MRLTHSTLKNRFFHIFLTTKFAVHLMGDEIARCVAVW
jgi:hypothetical protein